MEFQRHDQILFDIFTVCWSPGKLLQIQKEASIILLLKPGKDGDGTSSYIPVILLPLQSNRTHYWLKAKMVPRKQKPLHFATTKFQTVLKHKEQMTYLKDLSQKIKDAFQDLDKQT